MGTNIELEAQRTVTYDEATAYCQGINAPYVETSAPLNIGVDYAFELLVLKVIEQRLQENAKSRDIDSSGRSSTKENKTWLCSLM